MIEMESNKESKKINVEEIKELMKKERGVNVNVVNENDSISFKCHSCGRCCTRDVIENVLLRSYDMYRIVKGSNYTPTEIIEKCNRYVGKASGIPILQIGVKQRDGEEVCMFLDENNKCSIHKCKPMVCKTYPLGRVSNGEESVYIDQDMSCFGDRDTSETVKVKDFLGDMSEANRAFAMENKLLDDLHNICDMGMLNNILCQVFDKDTYNDFYITLAGTLYVLDTDRDFFSQMEERIIATKVLILDVCKLLLEHKEDIECDFSTLIKMSEDEICRQANELSERLEQISK